MNGKTLLRIYMSKLQALLTSDRMIDWPFCADMVEFHGLSPKTSVDLADSVGCNALFSGFINDKIHKKILLKSVK